MQSDKPYRNYEECLKEINVRLPRPKQGAKVYVGMEGTLVGILADDYQTAKVNATNVQNSNFLTGTHLVSFFSFEVHFEPRY